MKLEDIDKDNIFKVPERYFDELPGRIQSRVRTGKRSFLPEFGWSAVLKVSGSIAAVLLFVIFFAPLKTQEDLPNPEALLAQVHADDVIAYLELTDINIDDLIAETDLSTAGLWQDDEDPLIDELELNEDQLRDLIDQFQPGKEYLYN